MYSWFLIALTIIFAVIVAKLILKKYNAIFVFFASGVVILMTASLLHRYTDPAEGIFRAMSFWIPSDF